MTCDPLCSRGELSMSTAKGVSRGFRRLGIFLAAIAFLVVVTVLFGPAQASLSNPIAQTPVGVRPEAPYACAVKGTQYALELKREKQKGTEEYKHGSEPQHNFDRPPNLPNNGIAAEAKKDMYAPAKPGHEHPHFCTKWEERFDIDKGVMERRCLE